MTEPTIVGADLSNIRLALETMKAHFEPSCQGHLRYPMVWALCKKALYDIEQMDVVPVTILPTAEVERLRRELAEANEAIRELTDAGDAMRFSMPTAAMAGKSMYDNARKNEAVRRAIGGERE